MHTKQIHDLKFKMIFMNKLSIYQILKPCVLVLLFLSSLLISSELFAQAETEPNGAVGQSGTQTVAAATTITGTVFPTPDVSDLWIINDGAAGTFVATWASAGITVSITEYTTTARTALVPGGITGPLTSGASVTLNVSNFYSVTVSGGFSGTAVPYSVVLSGTSLPASNTAPTAASFVASNGPFEDLAYTFSTGDFSYNDTDSDPLDNVLIEIAPAAGTLFVDGDGNNVVGGGEALSNGSTVSLADLNAGRLKYLQNGSTNTSLIMLRLLMLQQYLL